MGVHVAHGYEEVLDFWDNAADPEVIVFMGEIEVPHG